MFTIFLLSLSVSSNSVGWCICIWQLLIWRIFMIIRSWWTHSGVPTNIVFNHKFVLISFDHWCEYSIAPRTEVGYVTPLWCALLSKLQVIHCLTWSQMEDADGHDRAVMARWVVLLIPAEAWTVQLFLCLMSNSVHSRYKRADEAPFSIGSEKQTAQTGTDSSPSRRQGDRHFVNNLEAVSW